MKKATLLLSILLCIATLCGCNESATESLPESEAVSQTVSEVSENGNSEEESVDASNVVSEMIEIDYDAVLYSPSELDVYRGTMDDPQYFRENGIPLQGPSLEEYLEENTVSDETYIYIQIGNYDKRIDDLLGYLKGVGYIENEEWAKENPDKNNYSCGYIPYKGLKQLYEDNYGMEYIWLRKDAEV